jgi:hypothetical protein
MALLCPAWEDWTSVFGEMTADEINNELFGRAIAGGMAGGSGLSLGPERPARFIKCVWFPDRGDSLWIIADFCRCLGHGGDDRARAHIPSGRC